VLLLLPLLTTVAATSSSAAAAAAAATAGRAPNPSAIGGGGEDYNVSTGGSDRNSKTNRRPWSSFLPGRRGFPEDDDEDYANSNNRDGGGTGGFLLGTGRELSLFDTMVKPPPTTTTATETAATQQRGGDTPPMGSGSDLPGGYAMSTFPSNDGPSTGGGSRRRRGRGGSGTRRRASARSSSSTSSSFFGPVKDWWQSNISPSIKNWPKIECIVEPTTTLKIRKTFRPLKLTVVRLGADFNTQLGVWQFKSSWEDEIIGGKLTLAGRELQLTKSWQLTGGGFGLEDLVTRLRLRAAVDISTWKAYARVGFRTERLRPINVMEGFTILKQVPLDGGRGNVKLEVKANIALPEPEIEYSTETQRSLVGMGDIEVNIEELNLLLDY